MTLPQDDPALRLLTEQSALNTFVKKGALASSARDFGANGDNFVTDDTAALEAWLLGGGLKFLPAGQYRTTRELKVPSNTVLFGAGRGTSVIRMDAAVTDRANVLTNASNNHASRTTYDENIYISDLTVDCNAWNRDMPTGYEGMNGSALTLSTVRNVIVERVEALNGYLHGIDVGASEYPAVEGLATYAAGPSYNVVIRDCQSVDCRLDDAFTSHYSRDILFDHCAATRTAAHPIPGWTQQGFEIDDGSWRITVQNCYVNGYTKGYQAKGHTGAPAAYDVTFRGCVADACVLGFDVGYDDPTVVPASAGIAKNVIIDNCEAINLAPFPDTRAPGDTTTPYYTDTRVVQIEGYRGVRIRNFTSRNNGLYGGITVGAGASNIKIEGFHGSDICVGATDTNKGIIHLFNSAGKNIKITDVEISTPVGVPVFVDSAGGGQIRIEGVYATGTNNTVPCVKFGSYGGTRNVENVFSTGFLADIQITGGASAGTYTQGTSKINAQEVFANSAIYLNSKGSATGAVKFVFGAGSPESVVTANPGSLYLNTSGGASTTLYVKQTGTGSTGWAAK